MSVKKILVADDSLTIQKVIRLALSHEGYDIQTASEGNEAIEQILLFRPKLVLIDVSLPGKSAVEVKAEIDSKPELAGTQFVLMSSAFENVDEAAIARAGFSGRLTKPFDPAHLRKLVSEGLGASQEAPASLVPPPPLPVMSAPAETDSLWETPEMPPLAPPALPPQAIPQPPVSSAPSEDSDIRQLTQSTLQMAGLDDLDWSVSEASKKEPITPPSFGSPGLPPFSSLQLQENMPTLAPLGSGAASSYFSPEAAQEIPPPVPAQPMQAESYALPVDELEAMVRQQVELALQKISKEMLPGMAERILKQEINRLLNEIP